MAAFFWNSPGGLRLRVNGGTTSIRFSAASNAGNFYRMGFPGLGPGGTTFNLYKNQVDFGSAGGTSFYTTNISVIPIPTPQANNSPTRFVNTEIAVTATANTDYAIEWQDIRFQGLPNPYPIGSFGPGSPQAAGASIDIGSTNVGGTIVYPYAGSVFGLFRKRYTFVFHLAAWRTITEKFVFHLGAWRTIQDTFVLQGGVWRDTYRNYDTSQVMTINEPGADALDYAAQVFALN